MKRSHITPGLIPQASLPAGARAQATGASPRDQRKDDWFRIENKAGEADIYIYDEIGFWGTTAAKFASDLRDLDVKNITLHLNSPGGEVFDGVAIYNTLVNHKATVHVVVDGLAASAASFIAQAGDEVTMGQGSTMMIHDASGFAWGNSEEMHKTAEILDGLSQTIAGLYSARAGGSPDMWRGMMRAETWYNADEAVEAGLADKVSAATVAEPVEDRWNLSVFNFAGRGEAPSPQLQKQSVMNRVTKESAVPPIKNEDESVEPTEPVVPAEVEAEEDGDEEVSEDTQPIVEPEALPVSPPAPENKATTGFIVNGVRVTDASAIQAHIAGLEQYAKEQKDTARKAFVDKLSEDGKILATQEDGLHTLVDSLNDEQYGIFCATWDAAQPLPLFARHGHQSSTSESQAAVAQADRLEVVRGIVQHHRQSGMKEAELVTKDSYIELQALEAKAAGTAV